jgi:hypothetical protein
MDPAFAGDGKNYSLYPDPETENYFLYFEAKASASLTGSGLPNR